MLCRSSEITLLTWSIGVNDVKSASELVVTERSENFTVELGSTIVRLYATDDIVAGWEIYLT